MYSAVLLVKSLSAAEQLLKFLIPDVTAGTDVRFTRGASAGS